VYRKDPRKKFKDKLLKELKKGEKNWKKYRKKERNW
jgi:hypothetical protein